MRHFIVHTRRAGHLVTRPLNCGVMRARLPRAIWIALLWSEAVLCFGPLLSMLVFGVLLLPIWIFSLVADVTGLLPNVEAAESIWPGVRDIAIVLCGVLGTAGLITILRALTTGVAEFGRWQMLAMVSAGIIAATGFFVSQPIDMREQPVAFAMFCVLPLFGTVHLLYMARHVLSGRQSESSAVVRRA